MTPELRLVVFDVDGTLVDSQADILSAMGDAFARAARPAPARAEVLGVVGLSLPVAMETLAPGEGPETRGEMVEAYKQSYAARRAAGSGEAPLYPGVAETVERLAEVPHWLLGIATGKSRRGLDALLGSVPFGPRFVTTQTADQHPSKPHPAMLEAALSETGVAAERAVMVGDTAYDMEMARAAGAVAIGVTWGYHPRARLTAAHHLIDDIAALPALLNRIWGER
ncbi:HAD-IA family hydrolase [Roseivivax sp. GX 12232]|uniref:HAD-IA family hydrolase n=1 Tax=Roseivivax sp. GX 12232 TaxID=2900547 RepID=UPI001E4A727B|nr:HAD-IA family hydrolase [Roseivivax sp. GX 12232]MCE0507108.1 HAD-IA family hydrolase [Roseivivax sp. GX 12232]